MCEGDVDVDVSEEPDADELLDTRIGEFGLPGTKLVPIGTGGGCDVPPRVPNRCRLDFGQGIGGVWENPGPESFLPAQRFAARLDQNVVPCSHWRGGIPIARGEQWGWKNVGSSSPP